jgi:hypothetical protein
MLDRNRPQIGFEMTASKPPEDQRAASAEPSPSQRPNPVRHNVKSKTLGGVLLAVFVAVYAFAQPLLNERLGWQLPGIERLVGDAAAPVDAGVERQVMERAQSPTGRDVESSEPLLGPQLPGGLLHGILVDQGNDRFRSPEGLLYVRGSQEGHRLKHLERHTVDDPGRPGRHGVFDGGMQGALMTIDKAYRKAKTGVQTSVEEEDGRTIYTVDMGTRVGFVGGSEGQRRRNPMARRVRLVLEQNRVITAYPI